MILDPGICETLEEILKHLQFQQIDLESTGLDDEVSYNMIELLCARMPDDLFNAPYFDINNTLFFSFIYISLNHVIYKYFGFVFFSSSFFFHSFFLFWGFYFFHLFWADACFQGDWFGFGIFFNYKNSRSVRERRRTKIKKLEFFLFVISFNTLFCAFSSFFLIPSLTSVKQDLNLCVYFQQNELEIVCLRCLAVGDDKVEIQFLKNVHSISLGHLTGGYLARFLVP